MPPISTTTATAIDSSASRPRIGSKAKTSPMPNRPISPNSEPRPPMTMPMMAAAVTMPGRWPDARCRTPDGGAGSVVALRRAVALGLVLGRAPAGLALRSTPLRVVRVGTGGGAGHGAGFLLGVHSAVVAERWRSVRRATGPWGDPATLPVDPGGLTGPRRARWPAKKSAAGFSDSSTTIASAASRKSRLKTMHAAGGGARRCPGCRRSRSA